MLFYSTSAGESGCFIKVTTRSATNGPGAVPIGICCSRLGGIKTKFGSVGGMGASLSSAHVIDHSKVESTVPAGDTKGSQQMVGCLNTVVNLVE